MINYKICTICKLSKESKDYIGSAEECFKCVYNKKVLLMAGKQKVKSCKFCKTKLPVNRWTYCSEDCAAEAKHRSRHWTQTVVTYDLNFRNFNFKKTTASMFFNLIDYEEI